MQRASAKLLAEWQARANGDVYRMMRTAHRFAEVLPADPLAGMSLAEGDAKSLKKAYHKLATKLHPDRQTGNSVAVQVLAEEVFKVLTAAYQKEANRLLSV